MVRIAVALGNNINEFLWGGIRPDDVSTISVVKAQDRQHAELAPSRFGYEFASVAHDGEQIVFVLSGKIHFEIGSRDQLTRWLLEPGDCMYFDSHLSHRGYGVEGDATALVVELARMPDSTQRVNTKFTMTLQLVHQHVSSRTCAARACGLRPVE